MSASTLHLGSRVASSDETDWSWPSSTGRPTPSTTPGAPSPTSSAMSAVDAAVAAGAEIVDIGGVKAGPGDEVDLDEELAPHRRLRRRSARAPP